MLGFRYRFATVVRYISPFDAFSQCNTQLTFIGRAHTPTDRMETATVWSELIRCQRNGMAPKK